MTENLLPKLDRLNVAAGAAVAAAAGLWGGPPAFASALAGALIGTVGLAVLARAVRGAILRAHAEGDGTRAAGLLLALFIVKMPPMFLAVWMAQKLGAQPLPLGFGICSFVLTLPFVAAGIEPSAEA